MTWDKLGASFSQNKFRYREQLEWSLKRNAEFMKHFMCLTASFKFYKGFEMAGLCSRIRLHQTLNGYNQGCISCETCSYPELTEDHVLTSAYVKVFRIVTRNAANKSFWRKKDCSWPPLKQICNEYLMKFSENQSAPKLENRKTSPCSPCAPNVLHVLVSRILGYHNLCSPAAMQDFWVRARVHPNNSIIFTSLASLWYLPTSTFSKFCVVWVTPLTGFPILQNVSSIFKLDEQKRDKKSFNIKWEPRNNWKNDELKTCFPDDFLI